MRRERRRARPGWRSRERASSVSPWLDVEEGGFAFALQDHVESVKSGLGRSILAGGEERTARGRIGNRGEDGVGLVGRLVGEVDARGKLPQEPSCENRQVEVRRLRSAARPGDAAGLDGGEAIFAARIGERAAEPAKPGALLRIAALRIRLP